MRTGLAAARPQVAWASRPCLVAIAANHGRDARATSHHGRDARATFIAALALLGVFVYPLLAAPPGIAPASRPSREDNVVVDEKTEAVIDGALKYLAAQQQPGGAFAPGQYSVAFTAYSLMAFMSAGNLPGEGPYGKTVQQGIDFLLDSVRPDGLICGRTQDHAVMYGHGIATLVLAELYGQTSDPLIRPKLEKAIGLIVACQNDAGGWRYQPRKADADISVTVLQVVALRAAKNAGLDVPQTTIDKAIKFVKSCHDPATGGFTYIPKMRGGAGFARTAAAVYSLQVCGLYDDPLVATGSKYLEKHIDDRMYVAYGNFYAAPAQYMIGGDTWEKWYPAIKDRLMQRVKRQGETYFWDGRGMGDMSPIYATAVYTTVLAMPYHYIPLYQR